MGFVKISVLCFYLRIFGPDPTFRLCNSILIFVVAAWAVATVLTEGLICRPWSAAWTANAPPPKCGNPDLAYWVPNIVNVATDILVLILPLPSISRLQISKRRRIGLSMVFLTGSA